MRTVSSLACVLLAVSFWSSSLTQDTTITYQGQLQQAGEPVNGTANLEFRLFDQPSDGNQVGLTQTRDDWPVENGLFQVELDFGAAAFAQQVRYLEVWVDGSALTPRQAVRPSPMALFALTSGDASWNQVAAGLEYNDGRVRIGHENFGTARLRVDAVTSSDAIHGSTSSPGGRAIYGVGNAINSVGVYGDADVDSGFGVTGRASGPFGTGVLGGAFGVSGTNYGVRGISDSTAGRAVDGLANAISGTNFGVRGQTNSPSGFAGYFLGPAGSRNYFERRVGVGVLNPLAQLHVQGDSSQPNPLRLNRSTGAVAMVVNGNGRVGIGTAAPISALHAVSDDGDAVYGLSSSTSGRGLYGVATASTGETYGVRGDVSSNQGSGILGMATASSGTTNGVWGRSFSSSGRGVLGQAIATSGTTYGVYGQVSSPSGFAGYFLGPDGSRNYFQRRVGIGTSNPGTMLDVTGSGNLIRGTHSNGHIGIIGDTNAGVYGRRGGAGSTPQGWLGENNAGVRGFAGTGTWAGLFEGNVNVTGSLSKGGGSFKIDHPLDPENKYLFHSFVESPDMMNIYNGNVVTDHDGHAIVELPDYFETLNTDFRYQLTVIGVFAQAIVAEKIADNHFIIATDQPNVEVSWQVTGIRDDAWARANRIEVEVPKPEHERGYYLHPEAFGVEVREREESAVQGKQ